MKVFLSHSTKDADFVERLAIALKDNGFTPWRCEVDIDKGENFVARINDGLAQSQIALLVWSPDAALSAWTKEEWTAALLGRVEGQRMRLGLILLRGEPDSIPALLRTSNRFDARSNQAAGIRDTITWLKGRQSLQRLSGNKAPVYLPEYRPKDFVGRSAYMTKLQDEFFPYPGKFLLYGEPGSGKSTIALQFAWDAQKDLDAVIWQTCGQRSLDAITAELVERLPSRSEDLPPDQQRQAAKEWLRQRQSLLILDDVWSPDVIQLEPKGACSVLYTSRMQSLPGVAAKQTFKVEKFTEKECDELFHSTLDDIFGAEEVSQHHDGLLAFARTVEMLPIAVAVGANLLREKAAIRLDKGVKRLKPEALTDGVKNVPELFRKAIDSQPEREQKLLAACAVCVQEGFWMPLAAQIAELSEDEVDDAANALVHGSLLRVLDRDRQGFQMHALLPKQVQATLGDSKLRELQERHAVALETLFEHWETRWQECRECLGEIVPATSYLFGGGQWDRESRLAYNGFELARRTGEYGAAFAIAKSEQSLWFGTAYPDAKSYLGSVFRWQGLILCLWGQMQEALNLFQEEEKVWRELGDKGQLQSSYGNQANILYAWGRLEEALELLKKQEAICLELGNKNSLQISYGNQANILYAWGRLEEALELLKKQEAICLELGNKNSLQISYGNQANILYAWGRLEEAMALHKKEEAIALELGSKDQLQRSFGNQANILKAWGRLEEALELLKKQEAICLELSNKNSLSPSYGNQALILIKLERYGEALTLLEESEAICLDLGNKSSLGYCYWQWAWLAGAQGDRQTEEQKLQQALAIFTEHKLPRQRDAVQAELDKIATSN